MRALILALTGTAAFAGDVCVRHIVVPDYPALARTARLQGTVAIVVQIGPDGSVISAQATGATGLLQEAAKDNIRHWTFSPADSADNGRAAVTRLAIEYVYRLEGSEAYGLPRSEVLMDLPVRVQITTRPPQAMP